MADTEEEKVSKADLKYMKDLRLECIRLAVNTADPGIESKEPWARANKFFNYVVYGKPDGSIG